ncbi:MAG: DNA translocase FtsK 4TM domain-containing protein, partial [Desulfovibrionaceae bacterium]|nr:DNA translocase FtsK 4TM domain-containing protein [Desulfovibrionaceae bacterium]
MAQSQEQSLPFKSGYTSELAGLGLFFWAVFLVLALLSFDKGDPTLNHVRSVTEIHNKAGLFGAYVSGFLNEWFGLCAFLWPLFFVAIAGPCLSSRLTLNWRRWVGIFILTLFLMETVVAWNLQFGDFSPGGILGNGLYQSSVHFLNPLGASLFWLFIFLVALQLIINISWIDLFVKLTAYLKAKHEQIQANRTKIPSAKTSHQGVTPLKNTANFLTNCLNFFKRKSEDKIPNLYQKAKQNSQKSNPTSEKDPFLEEIESPLTKVDWEEDVDVRQDPKSKKQIKAKAQAKPTPEPEITPEPEPEEMVEAELPIPVEMPKPKPVKLKETPKASPTPTPTPKTPKVKKEGPFELPPLDILREPQHVENEEDLEEKGNILIQTLREFNIESELVDITPGPVVTLFEVRPAA